MFVLQITILSYVCLGFDFLTVCLYTLVGLVFISNPYQWIDVIIPIILVGTPVLHMYACAKANQAAHELKVLMRPVRCGTVVLV